MSNGIKVAARRTGLGGHGFSLPELLAVMAVISGVVLSGFLTMARQPSARLRAASHEMLFAFHLARARAIALDHTVYLDFAPAPLTPKDGVYAAFADLNENRQEDPGEREAAQVMLDTVRGARTVKSLPRGVRFGAVGPKVGPGDTALFADGVSFSGGLDRIGFYPHGNSSAGTVYITLGNDPPYTWAVRANLSGTFETWSWEGGPWRRRS